MKIDLDRSKEPSLREQICAGIAERIRSGLLQPGEQLPSVRQLAQDLGVSLMTAVQAYGLLEKRGLVESVQGRGTFVRERAIATEASGDPFGWQLAIGDYLPRASFWSQSAVRLPPEILDLATASIHHSLLPLPLLEASIQSALKQAPQSLGRYAPFQGDPEFLAVVAGYLQRQGLSLSTHQLIITNGTQQGIDLFARTFLGPNDVLAMEAPAFSGAIDAFRLSHGHIVPVPVDREGIRLEILEDLSLQMRIKAIYVVPTYQNPTGSVMSLQRRKALIDFAVAAGALILEDEPHRELTLADKGTGRLPPPLKALDPDGRVVYLKGFSKFLFPGLRLGVLAADGALYRRLLAAKSIVDLGSPLWLQKALVPFFQNPQLPRYIDRLNSILLQRSRQVADTLSRRLSPAIRWQRPQGGMHLWVTLPPFLDADSLLPEAHRRGIHFLPGSIFYPGEPESNHLRICWTNLADAELPGALECLCDVLNEAVR
ncbi:aminotransferase class I/II-fold pyridoxal phosphate-dependent enzyme [Heliobacterium gestii]|uniref:Aminotransferase class I/II-fold pyridoxal phosphate-dependent enzyme n=1 Tax=Heliomicrobium gestii TaxID=2699 RepID=A0A845LJC0_HELGE|nr:PLP-dependent aminotransferase family protein [Heliomicrobium gestii]MBM7868304.1 DNA-binding transcriptional MocR family regulator [Heliomicrobium gestii]MZP44495.1 aminotransferase class I/II-fold pyridoxal phosphate-dependent enzyme [Heliomicrobium gestii]